MKAEYNIPDSQFKVMDLQHPVKDHEGTKYSRFMILCSLMMYEKGKAKRTRFYMGTTRMVTPKSRYNREHEIRVAKKWIKKKLQETLETGKVEIGAAKKKKFIDVKKTNDTGVEFVTHSKVSSDKFNSIPMVVAES